MNKKTGTKLTSENRTIPCIIQSILEFVLIGVILYAVIQGHYTDVKVIEVCQDTIINQSGGIVEWKNLTLITT